MKKQYALLLLLAAPLLKAQGQGMIELGGTGALSLNDKAQHSIAGGGGTLGFYYDIAPLLRKQPAAEAPAKPLHLYAGAEMSLLSLGQRNFDGMPLSAPQSGLARVQFQDALYNFNAAVRVSYDCMGGKLRPYADLLAGYRYVTSEMKIFPNDEDLRTSAQRLSTARGFNTGIGAGLVMDFSKNKVCCFNIGAEFNHCMEAGQLTDLSQLERTESGINYSMRRAPQDVVIIKAGITVLLDFSKTEQWRRLLITYLSK